ncbi:DUF2125 domain-containing protein [Sphingosinicella soli]|uniref:DUF2125 domain-containing protein n=1 Tax=Sphingosinicella soli TaxID=333708 RepID=A0A7W7FAN3_9SPHN|nr:DUF2125 domain-containing protein [Sphingosinicella soli]MBB4633848.1 hypothetical protein [Sphingosinicella soli]
MRRLPFWVAVLPLLLGLGAYWLYWNGESKAFGAFVAERLGVPVAIAGFPYRIEIRTEDIDIRRQTRELSVAVQASKMAINRQPWRTGHAVIEAQEPRLQVALARFTGMRLDIEAPTMLASIRRPGDTLERLSLHFGTAKVWLPFAGGPFDATDFELHLRETPDAAPLSRSPTLPVRAEARIAGTLTRAGTSLGLNIPLFVTARGPIASLEGWRSGGTIEAKGAQLLLEEKPLADIEATLAPLPDGRIAVSGTISSECPFTVKALLEGGVPATEYRARRARTMTLTGDSAAGLVVGAPEGASGGPVRSQEPPCPVLRR